MASDRADQAAVTPDTPGLFTRPPLIYLAALLLGGLLDRMLPLPVHLPGTRPAQLVAGVVLALAGLALARAAIGNFTRKGTPYRSIEPTTALVTTGLHGLSRNPIYLGLFLIYGGIGVATGSEWILLLILPLAVTIRYTIVAREEAYLERRFGAAYRDYAARVHRWL